MLSLLKFIFGHPYFSHFLANVYHLVSMTLFDFIEDHRMKCTWIYKHEIAFKLPSLSDSKILIRFSIVLAKLESVLLLAKL